MEPWYTRPEWWLAAIAVLTFLAICYQAKEMARATKAMRESTTEVKRQADILERQTKATEEAAKAALLNAKAVIASERPWVVVSPEKSDAEKPNLAAFVFRITNRGRTPAQIETISLDWCFDSYHDGSRLPPNYRTRIYPPHKLIAPSGGFDLYVKDHPDKTVERAELQERVAQGNQFLIYDGKITYWDALSGEGDERVLHETVWCYYFNFANRTFFRIEEFNRHT
jgi:hypothetical protein